MRQPLLLEPGQNLLGLGRPHVMELPRLLTEQRTDYQARCQLPLLFDVSDVLDLFCLAFLRLLAAFERSK